ncbi:hypothetical protein JVU11DRAFT_12300 [Chiua virens]|nr:hypothetical protein JVU11DRAFT_12300 [Chiua virens]
MSTDMSLFRFFVCSTPERRSGDKTLPIIPNEIYLLIFQHLTWDLRMLARLRRTCKFFANVCLPHMFRVLEFCSIEIPSHANPNMVSFFGQTLFRQIAANHPASLTLAKSVQVLRLNNRHADSWTRGLTPNRHLSSISLMTNIHQLELWDCLVDVNHWRTMASLPLLEKLRFSSCEFLLSPPGVKPETTDKLRFSLLEVRFCVGRFRPMVSVDARNLRTLDAPLDILLDIDFLPQSALTGLVLGGNCRCPGEHPWDLHVIQMRDILERLPDSIQMLSISIFDFVDSIIDGPTDDILRFIFASPAWSNFRHLRSLKLEINHYGFREDAETLPPTLDGIAHLTNLQSLTSNPFFVTDLVLTLASLTYISLGQIWI